MRWEIKLADRILVWPRSADMFTSGRGRWLR